MRWGKDSASEDSKGRSSEMGSSLQEPVQNLFNMSTVLTGLFVSISHLPQEGEFAFSDGSDDAMQP